MCERAEEGDHIFTNKTEDLQQEAKSRFYVLYESRLNDFLQSNIYHNHVVEDEPVTNPYYNKQFCNQVMTVIIPRICATSKLMVGDLSRHINRSTSIEESGYYAKRNETFLKLQEVNFQTILINNRTQAAVEQHFGDMKHHYFNNGRLDRLDGFVYDFQFYHSSGEAVCGILLKY